MTQLAIKQKKRRVVSDRCLLAKLKNEPKEFIMLQFISGLHTHIMVGLSSSNVLGEWM